MKTKYLYVGKNIFLINKFKIALYGIDVVIEKSPLSAIKHLNANSEIEVVLFEATEDKTTVMEFVQLIHEKRNRNILFFMLVNTKKYLSKNNIKINKLLKQGADDIFYINVDIHLTNKDIQKKCKRIEFFIENKTTLTSHIQKKGSDFKIPLWKRSFDILFSTLAIIGLSPVLVLTAIAIRFESKGPVFYTSKRVGTGYKIFNFLKFRSMSVDADKKVDALIAQNQYTKKINTESVENNRQSIDEDPLLIDEGNMIFEKEFLVEEKIKQEASFFKISNDPRITKVGKFIRNTSIDELLQLFNIFKGDMSVVGNRPLPLYEAETLTTDRWIERFLAPAGLTGLWQVTKRAQSTQMSADERKQLDIDYSRNYSFTGDLKIILRTIPALLQHENV
jgi:lipopolysaccharide/colanic/teichoic acid biosynthesis glycosyltransferase